MSFTKTASVGKGKDSDMPSVQGHRQMARLKGQALIECHAGILLCALPLLGMLVGLQKAGIYWVSDMILHTYARVSLYTEAKSAHQEPCHISILNKGVHYWRAHRLFSKIPGYRLFYFAPVEVSNNTCVFEIKVYYTTPFHNIQRMHLSKTYPRPSPFETNQIIPFIHRRLLTPASSARKTRRAPSRGTSKRTAL